MIYVVNKYKHKADKRHDAYIGRGSEFGNPFTHKPLSATMAQFHCVSRETSITSFRAYFYERIRKDTFFRNEALKLIQHAQDRDLNLVCFCAPKSCHGDIIKSYIETYL